MYVTVPWWEAWMWVAATRPQGSVSVSRVIRGFTVRPAKRVFTWITLLGSVCHVNVVHMEPSAYSATGKQQRVEDKLILFYQGKKKGSYFQGPDRLKERKRSHRLTQYLIYFYFLILYIIFNVKTTKLLIYRLSSLEALESPVLLCDSFFKFHGKKYWESGCFLEAITSRHFQWKCSCYIY